MRCRRLVPVLLAAALAAPSAASAAATPAVPTAATLDTCHTSTTALGRYAIFTAQMGTIDGATRMQVRFDVSGRAGAGRKFRALYGPGLGRWRSSAPGIQRYLLHKQVANLPAGGDARAVVSFRWIGAHRAVLHRARRRTPLCHQPDLRPDLVIDGVATQPGDDSGHLRYVLALRNAGVGDAGPFDVAFDLGGSSASIQAVTGLLAGERRLVTFAAPRCAAGDPVHVTADTSNRVDEAVERDDDRTFTCPSP